MTHATLHLDPRRRPGEDGGGIPSRRRLIRRLRLRLLVGVLVLCASGAVGYWFAVPVEPPLRTGMSTDAVSNVLGEPLYHYEDETDYTYHAVYRQGSEWVGYRVTAVTYGADFGGPYALRWDSHTTSPGWVGRTRKGLGW
jgi:hypothetical protein